MILNADAKILFKRLKLGIPYFKITHALKSKYHRNNAQVRHPRMLRCGQDADGGVFMFSEETIFSAVACGDRFTAAVTTDGDMYTWGVGERGRLGLGRDVGDLQVGSFFQSRTVFSFRICPNGFL